MSTVQKKLESIFTPPVFENDEEKTHSAKLLNFILLTMIGLTLFYTITAPFTHDDPTPLLVTSIFLFTLWVGGLIFNKKGFVQQTAIVFVSIMWLAFTLIAVYGGGSSSPSLINYFIVIIVATILISAKAGLIIAGMSSLSGLGLFIAKSNGVLPEASLASTPSSTLAILIGNFIMAAVLLWLTSQNIRESFRRAQLELAERRAIEKELRFSEQKFSKAFHSSPDSVTLSELESGRFIEVNDGFQEVYGYSREEALGRTALELGLYQNPADRNKLVQTLREQGSVHNLEFAARHKSGFAQVEPMPVYLNRTDRDQWKNPCLGFTIASRHQQRNASTPKKNARGYSVNWKPEMQKSETLRESAAAIASSLELNETVDRILDQLQRVVPYDSASVQLLIGDELEIIGGRGFPEGKDATGMRFPFDEDDAAYPILKDELPYIFYPNVQAVSDKFKGSDHEHVLSWMAIPLYARGRLIGMFALDGFTVDKFSKAHAKFALTFANHIAVSLENSRLYTALQAELTESEGLITELESKNAELERFTYTVSHDLKSPLITIRGFLGYLEQDAIDGDIERLKNDIERISNAAGKMGQLLDELLELSRIGRLMNEPEEVSFKSIALEAVSLVEGRLKESNTKVKIGSNLPKVYGDRVRIG